MRTLLALALVACGDDKGDPIDAQAGGEVGRVCDPGNSSPNETVVASPSLDCASRMCLAIAFSQPAMCTATCVDASDCSESLESACPSGFACAPVVSVGPFACQKLCVCSDRVPVTGCN